MAGEYTLSLSTILEDQDDPNNGNMVTGLVITENM